MKTAVCYCSRHHGNTRKVLEAMAKGRHLDLIEVTARPRVRLEEYDRIGFASGIYYGKFHESVLKFASQHLPQGKEVFFVYTCGSQRRGYTEAIARAVTARGAKILGEYGCQGWDTFGPFKLVGGIAKSHPDTADLKRARSFYDALPGTRR